MRLDEKREHHMSLDRRRHAPPGRQVENPPFHCRVGRLVRHQFHAGRQLGRRRRSLGLFGDRTSEGSLIDLRRYLFALYAKAGKSRNKGSGKGVVVIRIPARPFLRPAFKAFSTDVQKRFLRRVAGILGMGGL